MTIRRTRPITFPDWAGKPREEDLSGWRVVKRFETEPDNFNIALTDLSHRPKALVHGAVGTLFGGLDPGDAVWNGDVFIGCIKPDEAFVFDITGTIEPTWPDANYTDMTEAWVLLGLFGCRSLEVMGRLVAVDVERPERKGAFCLVTRSHAMMMQVLNPNHAEIGFLLASERSHAQNFFNACIQAGQHLGLRLVGIEAFYEWFERLQVDG